MGNAAGPADSRPAHKVSLEPFQLSSTEISQAQFLSVMGYNFSRSRGLPEASSLPMEMVSWPEAVFFCNQLSLLSGYSPAYYEDATLTTVYHDYQAGKDWHRGEDEELRLFYMSTDIAYGNFRNRELPFLDKLADGYRLPTEAEWERAASGSEASDSFAWLRDNAEGRSRAVGSKEPNAFGLYDMLGNVWEWCWDGYGAYSSAAQVNPTGAQRFSRRVMRGGSWVFPASDIRISSRFSSGPFTRMSDLGFRVAKPQRGDVEANRAMLALARNGGVLELKDALSRGAPLEARDSELRTPLILAATYNSEPEFARALIQAGARFWTRDKKDMNALDCAAAFNGNPALLKLLYSVAPKPPEGSVLDAQNLFLRAAAHNPEPEILNTLIAVGAIWRKPGNLGRNALHIAASSNPALPVLRQLLQKGFEIDGPDEEGSSALMLAAGNNPNPDIAVELIKRGASLSLSGYNGKKAIHYAAESNPFGAMIRSLIAAGAKVGEEVAVGRPLELALYSNPSVDTFKALLDAGAKLEAPGKSYSTPLGRVASGNPNPELIGYLVSRGFDPNAESQEGETPLMVAAANHYLANMTLALLKAKARVNDADKDGRTALMRAAQNAYCAPAVAELLLTAGAKVNERDKEGQTALHYAAAGSFYVEFRGLLVKHGVNVGLKDKTGQTADQKWKAQSEY